MMIRFLCFVLILISPALCFCPKLFENQTVCSCDGTVEGPVIRCNGIDGLIIVDKLKTSNMEIKEFTLENANIIEIGPRAFKNLRIKKLNLDKNRIQKIHENAFRGLENVMQELSIAENSLTEVPTNALAGLKVLNILSLKCNKISNITKKAFVNMTSLIDVNLACNHICDLAPDVFENVQASLQNLILDNNCINKFPNMAIRNMRNLIALHMKNNKISALNQNDFTNLTSLSMLSLNGNEITYINGGALYNTPNLRYLYLNENNIEKFDDGAMNQFKQVQVVDLSFNNIHEVTAEMFRGLESIQHLNLDSNQIRDVAPGAFSGTPLLLLWLPNNCLTEVTLNTFQGAPFLRMVSLSNNNIKSIQAQSFGHLANLHTLDLANNKIVSLQNESLAGAENLSVRLQENPMVCTENGFHVWNGNEAINLTSEINEICKTNWQEETLDRCPKAQQRQHLATCCTAVNNVKATTEMPITTTEVVSPVLPTKQEKISSRSGNQNVNITADTRNGILTAHESTEKNSKKVNMERFWRLSQGAGGKSPFLKHVQDNKPKYLQMTTSTQVPKTLEEEDSDEAEYLTSEEEEVQEDDVESQKENTENQQRQVENSKIEIPARIRERQKMFAPWLQQSYFTNRKTDEFNTDGAIETVAKSN